MYMYVNDFSRFHGFVVRTHGQFTVPLNCIHRVPLEFNRHGYERFEKTYVFWIAGICLLPSLFCWQHFISAIALMKSTAKEFVHIATVACRKCSHSRIQSWGLVFHFAVAAHVCHSFSMQVFWLPSFLSLTIYCGTMEIFAAVFSAVAAVSDA